LRNAFARTVLLRAEKDRLILVTGDLGYGVFDELESKMPSHFLNAGITEQSLTSMAAGLHDEDWLPIIYSIANFPTFRNLEQIRNDIAYAKRHVIICSVGAGLSYGTMGFSHFGIEDVAILRPLPNMRILCPSDPLRATLATESAVAIPGPTYLRLGKNGEHDFGNETQSGHLPIRSISKVGASSAVFSSGSIGLNVSEAIQGLELDHYSVEEIWPLGDPVIDVIQEYGRIIIVEEHVSVGGLFSAISEELQHRGIEVSVESVAVDPKDLVRSGDHAFMLSQAGLDPASLRRRVETWVI